MITLDSEYFLKTDSNTWVLHYESHRLGEDGKMITSKDHWYYPSLKLCLKKYVDQSLKSSDSVEQLLSRVNYLIDFIDSKFANR